ncbi:hypothetical protein [Hymenobacter lucidus]|uniref:HEAT repeat domain-containing protein n=1 Tax=Hymenobacter lucidus TaxID=2880930 RepID=A0ABS8AWF7_9BACT|nr:hypothetical protein [Hymenobacter lucidus]MCB2410131.1 hypothetical protein [Hymenobacter lucidus]
MTWSFRSLLRAYSGLLAWMIVLVVSTWLTYDPDGYVGNRPDLLRLITPSLHTVRNAHLLWFGFGIGLLLFVGRAVAFRVHGRSTRHRVATLVLVLAGYAGGCWLVERGLLWYLAEEYYTIWKYQYGEKVAQPVLNSPTLLPWALRDVQDPAEPWHSRDKLVFALGFSGAQSAFPVLLDLAQDSVQEPDLRLRALLALRVLHPTRFQALLPTLPTDTAVALYQQHQRRYQ